MGPLNRLNAKLNCLNATLNRLNATLNRLNATLNHLNTTLLLYVALSLDVAALCELVFGCCCSM